MSVNHKNRNFKHIIDNYLQGKCSEEENAWVEDWFLYELKQNASVPEIDSELENKLWAKIQKGKDKNVTKVGTLKRLGWPSAAAAVLLLGFFVFFNNKNQIQTPSSLTAKAILPSAAIQASGEENILKLLPDSSLIILSKNSKLILSENFNKNNKREVTLIGKAFFDVKHNPSKPFIIHSGQVTTEVLGTSFDISSTENSKQVVINVIRGKVRVTDQNKQLGVLTKDMQIVYDENKGEAKVNQIDASKELSWNKADLEFNDVSFDEAKTLLEERFSVAITIPVKELQQTRFTTSLGQNESLEHFLQVLCEFNNASYTYNKNTKNIIIKPLNP